ncbi:DUF6084 family protein [Streptomyces sp. NPDC021749]|uniref:DUF6084 family protein n=1 Tax=Streptomyces sp. NPDC021749 TaxID=3154905 RepID=UPI003406951B
MTGSSAVSGMRGASAAEAHHGLPDLSFAVTGVGALPHAAVPTLVLKLAVARTGGGPIRSLTLSTAVRIDAARRSYGPAEALALARLFGQPDQWATSMQPLAWAQVTSVVPPFDDRTEIDLPIPCGGDAGLAAVTYLRAVRDGEVPLGLLFRGTVFHTGPGGRLATAQIPWDKEAACRLPAQLWHDLMSRYYGATSWLRLSHRTHDRLSAYQTSHGLPDAEQAVSALLDAALPRPVPTTEATWTP